jgi:hypothetical protein
MIIQMALSIILAWLLFPVVLWILGTLLGVSVGLLFNLPALIMNLPKTIALLFVLAFGFYGIFTLNMWLASFLTPDSTLQMTYTFLGTFGFIITGAILLGRRTGK